jgi:hypothetical protein
MSKAPPSFEQLTQLKDLERLNFGALLSETTSKERRFLLAAALLGVAIAQAGFLPTKISALGIDFERANQRSVLLLLALVLIYFILTFALYAAADLMAWRMAYNEAMARHLREEPALIPEPDKPGDRPWQKVQKELVRARGRLARFNRRAAVVRASWEFGLPLVVGIYVVVVLLLARHRLS